MLMNGATLVRAQPSQWWQGVEFLVLTRHSPGKFCRVEYTTFDKPMDEGEMPEPSFKLDPQAAIDLMDDLWKAGIRPRELSDGMGRDAAMSTHLTDMRKLVSHYAGVAL